MKLKNILSYLIVFVIMLPGIIITSAEDEVPPVPNMFYGNVTYNGEWCQTGTVIEAYINEELRSEDYDVVDGRYYIHVIGNESDDGKTIHFKINGTNSISTVAWQTRNIPESEELDLFIGDLPTSAPPDSSSSKDGKSKSSGNGNVSPTATTSVIDTDISEEGAEGIPIQTLESDSSINNTNEKTENKSPGFGVVFGVIIIMTIGFYYIKTINKKK